MLISRLAVFFAIMGPGIITGNVDNDAGGITTYSIVGARYQYSMLWGLLLTTIALIVIQEMTTRMGIVTGKGLADLIRERFGVRLTFFAMLILIFANLATTISDFAGIAAASEIIGLSRYIPFDAKTKSFTEDFAGSFVALNLSALSPTLIESELFGHRRGAYTGALEDRAGWLEVCPPLGTVFLDEIGELDAAIQVKLLRVIQTRTFQRLGACPSLRTTVSRAVSRQAQSVCHRKIQSMKAAWLCC
jgi:hypothetical protein